MYVGIYVCMQQHCRDNQSIDFHQICKKHTKWARIYAREEFLKTLKPDSPIGQRTPKYILILFMFGPGKTLSVTFKMV